MERHGPLKKGFVKENQAPFVNKELRKAIYTTSRNYNYNYTIIVVKTLPKGMKRSTKYKEINVCLLERKVLTNTLRTFPNIVLFQINFFGA